MASIYDDEYGYDFDEVEDAEGAWLDYRASVGFSMMLRRDQPELYYRLAMLASRDPSHP